MSKKEISVKFRTITPLWTGDAWQDNREIRPSSLMGSLRFWFSFYWEIKNGKAKKLNTNDVPQESLGESERENKKSFQDILKEKLKESNSFDEAIDKTLEKLGLSVPSRIFGCTGWKSRVKILVKDFSITELSFDDIEFNFPLNKLNPPSNSNFWIKKILFKENTSEPIKLFKNVEIKLTTTSYWWENYLKDFFKFFEDKIILVGGKNSFGFGFINMNVNDIGLNVSYQSTDKLVISKIEQIPYEGNKKVLGFNFKYYLRKKENRNFRENNFGKQGQASKVYVSNLLEDKSIYLLIIHSPFTTQGKIPDRVFEKYVGWLNKLEEENNDG